MTNGRINKRSALLAILCVLVMVFAVPVASAASYSKVYGQTQDKVRVRESASTNATIIDNIVKDACIYITSSKTSGSNTFVQVKYRASDGSTATGWVCQSDGRNTYVKVLSTDQAKSKFKVSSGDLPSKAVGTFTAAERKASAANSDTTYIRENSSGATVSKVQTELKALGCTHNAQHIRNAMLFLAKFHLNNVGLTLNYGIPGQTMQSWHNSLHAAVIMQAGHITAEPLAVTDAEGMPNAAERFEMFRYACEYLPENGYKMYAAGCFARPGYEYRARAMEWNGDDVIGMGVNGGSVYDGYAVRNTNNLKLYIKNAGDFEKLTAQAAQLDENALMLRYLRGRMKLNDGVVEPLFRERFGQELPQEFSTLLDKAVENGLAQRTADGWMPTLEGLFRGEVL